MRSFLDSFAARFTAIDDRSAFVIREIDDADLYKRPREMPQSFAVFTCGEYILRSAASVEQTFGGISTTLWDDPFEWTLPEKLSTKVSILTYLSEVESTRRKAWAYFNSDEDLSKRINTPEGLATILELLMKTVARAEHFQGRAISVFQFFCEKKLPRP